MKAVAWHGKRDVRVDTVPDPKIQESTDAIVRITSSGICGSDLHLYEVLGPFIGEGDIFGHEPMGVVEEVGSAVRTSGDRVVIPSRYPAALPHVRRRLFTQCEITQSGTRVWVRRCSGIRNCTGAFPAARPSIFGCRT